MKSYQSLACIMCSTAATWRNDVVYMWSITLSPTMQSLYCTKLTHTSGVQCQSLEREKGVCTTGPPVYYDCGRGLWEGSWFLACPNPINHDNGMWAIQHYAASHACMCCINMHAHTCSEIRLGISGCNFVKLIWQVFLSSKAPMVVTIQCMDINFRTFRYPLQRHIHYCIRVP